MVDHIATTLDIFIPNFVEAKKLCAKGKARFKRSKYTCDHILTLRAIIEEVNANKDIKLLLFLTSEKVFDIVS